MICIKVHDSYRRVVAVSDVKIIGKKFFEGKRQLDVRENFYRGTEFSEEEAVKQLAMPASEPVSSFKLKPAELEADQTKLVIITS